MHGNVEAGRVENLESSFNAGIQILAIFSAPRVLVHANRAHARDYQGRLESLRDQYQQHEQFTQTRMGSLRWRNGDPHNFVLDVPPDAQTALEEGKRAHEVLKGILNSGIQHLIPALFLLEEAKLKCGHKRIRQEIHLGHVDYAQTLLVRSVCCISLVLCNYCFCLTHPCWQKFGAAIQKILHAEDQDALDRHLHNPLREVQNALVSLHSSEATLSAAVSAAPPGSLTGRELKMLQQVKQKKNEIRALLKRVNGLPESRPYVESNDTSDITKFLLDEGKDKDQCSIACRLILSRRPAYIRAMLFASPWLLVYLGLVIFVVTGVSLLFSSSLSSFLLRAVQYLTSILLVATLWFHSAMLKRTFCVAVHSLLFLAFAYYNVKSKWEKGFLRVEKGSDSVIVEFCNEIFQIFEWFFEFNLFPLMYHFLGYIHLLKLEQFLERLKATRQVRILCDALCSLH
jgi:hypothetical protein